MKRFLTDWNRFWFAPQTGLALGLYRMVLGLLTIYSFGLFAKDVDVFFSDEGVLTTRTLESGMGRTYHTVLQSLGSPVGVRLALGALFASALCFTVGYRTRLASIVLYILVAGFHERNNLVLNGGDTVLRTMLFFFLFAPSGAALSVDSLIRRWRLPPGMQAAPVLVSPWAQRMMQVQVSVIYLVTAYAKSRGALYHDGSAMYYVFGLVDFNVPGVEQLMNYPVVYSFLTFVVLLAELSLPFLLWFRASRPYAILVGLLAHGWIIVAMIIPVFGTLMLATYLPFFSEDEMVSALARVKSVFARRRARVYVDGASPGARRLLSLLQAMDLFGRIDVRDSRTDLPTPGALTLVTPRGAILTDYDALRWMLPRLPATLWTLPFLYLPGGAPLGRWMMRRLASTSVADRPSPQASAVPS